MKKRKRTNCVKSLWVVLGIMTGIPGIVQADLRDILLKFQPYLGVQEEYTNNVNLAPQNKKSDFITTVYGGIRYSTLPKSETTAQVRQTPTEGEKYGIDLMAQAGFVYYAKGGADNYLSLAGALNSWYTWDNRLTFRLTDYLLRSDESREPLYPGALPPQYISGTFIDLTGLYLPGTQRIRSIWIRNIVSPSVEYKFSKEGAVSLTYVNNIYNNQSSLSQDSQENSINGKIAYWFNIRNGVSLEYIYTIGDFTSLPSGLTGTQDFTNQTAHGRYTYRFNPKTSIFGDYVFSKADFDPPGIDYYVNSPSLGIHHLFSPTLSGQAQFGYFWQSPARGEGLSGPVLNINLTQSGEKTTYRLFLMGGYQLDYFTAQNLGLTQYYTIGGTVTYRFTQKATAGLSGNVMWEKSKAAPNVALSNAYRKDTLWAINGNVSYALLKWLNFSLNLSYTEDHSNIPAGDYTEFRGLIKAEASYF